LVDEAEADLADLYDDDGNLLPIHDWPKIWRQGLVQGMDIEELFDGYAGDREQIGVVRAGPEKLDKVLRCVPPSIGGTEYGEASPFYG
jgi:hypothetical protein